MRELHAAGRRGHGAHSPALWAMVAVVDFENGPCAGVRRFAQSCCPVRANPEKWAAFRRIRVQPPKLRNLGGSTRSRLKLLGA